MDTNSKVLTKTDPEAKEILERASHVTVYSFDEKDQSWFKIGFEGPLFVYSRKCEPYYGIIILNRLALNHFVCHISLNQSIVKTESFLIYRDEEKHHIIGLWFYKQEEQDRVGLLWNTLIDQLKSSSIANTQPENAILDNKEPIIETTSLSHLFEKAAHRKSSISVLLEDKDKITSSIALPTLSSDNIQHSIKSESPPVRVQSPSQQSISLLSQGQQVSILKACVSLAKKSKMQGPTLLGNEVEEPFSFSDFQILLSSVFQQSDLQHELYLIYRQLSDSL